MNDHRLKKSNSVRCRTRQVYATAGCCPYIEYLPAELSESSLRRKLADEGLTIVDGRIALPSKPELGIELNLSAVERFAGAAEDLSGDFMAVKATSSKYPLSR